MSSALGCAMAATLPCRRGAVILQRRRRRDAAPRSRARRGRGARRTRDAAPRPRCQSCERLVERDVAPLEPRDELVELALELLERALLAQGRTSSTRAPRPPRASSTSTTLPAATAPASRTNVAAGTHDRVAAGERRERRERLQPRRAERSSAARRRSSEKQRRATQPLPAPPEPRRGRARGRGPRRRRGAGAPGRARRASSSRSGTTRRAAAVGVGARTSAARSHSGSSCSWPTAETTGTGHAATARTTRSSLNGSRSSKLPPPRARIDDVDPVARAQAREGAATIAPGAPDPARASRR